MNIRIPVFSGYTCIKFPAIGSKDRLDQLAMYCHNTSKCPFCRSGVTIVREYSEPPLLSTANYLKMCGRCGFWFGRGIREYDMDAGPWWGRFVIGKVNTTPIDRADIDTDQLIRALNADSALLTQANPFKAEDVVCELLKDYLDCDVMKLGGRKDGGIDGFALKGDTISTLIQVKWRRDSNRAEGVRVVRDVAGTQLVQGIPRSIIVTTRKRFTKPALAEAKCVEEREVVGVGKMSMTLKTYDDVLSMLEITTRRIAESPSLHLDKRTLDDLFMDAGFRARD